MSTKVTLKDVKPESFRVSGQDTNSHSRRMFFRAQPGHDNAVVSIVQSKVFPYRRKGDLLRHALERHLVWLESLAPIPSVTKQVDVILQIIREEEFNSDFVHVFDAVSKTIADYLAKGSSGQAVRVLLELQMTIAAMPDGYWKDQYIAEIERNFGHLVKEAMKAKLSPADAADDDEDPY